ncbi:unnamed protein product [Orchesella dallaii]|uniref:Guanylate-binding protein N-terminal domain-containing protein n=1 Tax=Orchesella dallaii TaxID=48710 RepID=A0ABP1RTB1_9HEXA
MAKLDSLVILRRVNGQLELDVDNLDKILETIQVNSDVPLAIISFIGGRGSGKTFYTNLLIQNLRNNSTGGWLSQVSDNKSCQSLPGFPFDKERGKSDVDVVGGGVTSEISLWAEAYRLENHGKQFVVLILHADFKGVDVVEKENEVNPLELFLALVSSRVLEIQWKKEEFRLLDIYRQVMERDEALFENILANNSLVYLFRTNRTPPKGFTMVDKQAVDHLKKLVNQSKLWEVVDLQNVNIAYVEDKKQSLLNTKGSLSLSTDMYHNLNAVINLIADDEEIFPKKVSATGELLTEGKLKEFMQTCVNLVNEIVGQKRVDAGSESIVQVVSVHPSPNVPSPKESHRNGKENSKTANQSEAKTRKPEPEKTKGHPTQRHQNQRGKESSQVKKTTTANKKQEDKISPDEDFNANPAHLELVKLIVNRVNDSILLQLKNWEQVDGVPITTLLPDIRTDLETRLKIFVNSVFDKAHEAKEQYRQWLYTTSSNNLNTLRQELINVQTLIDSFNGFMVTMITKKGKILPEDFTKLLENTRVKAKASLTNEICLEYIMRACNWLVSRYQAENPSEDIDIPSICLEQIPKFYEEEMKRIMLEGPYRAETLLGIHSSIMNRCMSVFITAVEPVPVHPNKLVEKLRKQFFIVKQSNRKMLQSLQKRVTNLIAKAKEKYDQNEELNNILNSNRINKREAQVAHQRAKAIAVQFLEERIGEGAIRSGEPVQGHRLTLIEVIDSYWQELGVI